MLCVRLHEIVTIHDCIWVNVAIIANHTNILAFSRFKPEVHKISPASPQVRLAIFSDSIVLNYGEDILLAKEPTWRTVVRASINHDHFIRYRNVIASNAFDTINKHVFSVKRAYDYAYFNSGHWFISMRCHLSYDYRDFRNETSSRSLHLGSGIFGLRSLYNFMRGPL
jgi:hypothetical protein